MLNIYEYMAIRKKEASKRPCFLRLCGSASSLFSFKFSLKPYGRFFPFLIFPRKRERNSLAGKIIQRIKMIIPVSQMSQLKRSSFI